MKTGPIFILIGAGMVALGGISWTGGKKQAAQSAMVIKTDGRYFTVDLEETIQKTEGLIALCSSGHVLHGNASCESFQKEKAALLAVKEEAQSKKGIGVTFLSLGSITLLAGLVLFIIDLKKRKASP